MNDETEKRKRKLRRQGTIAVFLAVLILGTGTVRMRAQNVEFERQRAQMILKRVADRIEENFHDEKLKGLDWLALVNQAKERIAKAQSPGQMYTAIFALTDQLDDSHTVFLPPGRVHKYLFGFEAKAFGDQILIYELKEKGAAERAGLRRGDRIQAINGYAAERGNFDLLMLYFRSLRPVTTLEITYSRRGEPPQKVVVVGDLKQGTMVTDLTDIDNIYQLIREQESEERPDHYGSLPDGIGYVHLSDFSSSEEHLSGLIGKVKDSRALIVDLRGNPGGIIDRLVYFAGFFEAEPVVLGELHLRKKTEKVNVKPKKPQITVPLFILIDSQSSSAAEMFSRHFQLRKRATVIGDRSSGRVTAARFFPEQIGTDTVVFYGVQVAVARVIFPDGSELEKRGVNPDVACLPTPSDLAEDMDPCRGRAMMLARKALGLPEVPIVVTPGPKKSGGL